MMLLRQEQRVDLVSAIIQSSTPTSLVTEEGLPVSVPSSLLRLFSPLMAELLDLQPCISTSIILPDTNIKTLSLLLDLIKDGKSNQDFTSIEAIQDLAGSLGIDLRNVNVSTGGQPGAARPPAGVRKQQRTVPVISGGEKAATKLKPAKNQKKVTKAKAKTSLLSKIKEEKNEEDSGSGGSGEKNTSYNCQVCEKTFNGINPLAFHYCKHFFKDLQSLNFQDFVDGNNCTKCNRTFPDKKAILCHVGVKHKYINYVLSANGLSKIPLGQADLPPIPSGISIKKEQAPVVLNDSGVNLTQKPKKHQVRVNFSGSKSRNSKEVKEIRVCEICDKEQENMSKLVNHMIGSHLLTEIKQKYAHLYNGKECLECNKPFAKGSVWGHLGAVHNKLDEVLIERGLRPIKVFVKRERLEQEEEMGGEEQELQISSLFASYDAATTDQGEPIGIDSHDVVMTGDPLI